MGLRQLWGACNGGNQPELNFNKIQICHSLPDFILWSLFSILRHGIILISLSAPTLDFSSHSPSPWFWSLRHVLTPTPMLGRKRCPQVWLSRFAWKFWSQTKIWWHSVQRQWGLNDGHNHNLSYNSFFSENIEIDKRQIYVVELDGTLHEIHLGIGLDRLVLISWFLKSSLS